MEGLLAVGPRVDRALITGGCGFVGSRLADALHKRGAQVILYDLVPPSWTLPQGITWVQGDVTDYEELEKALTDHGCVTAVFHLAAYGMWGEEAYDEPRIRAVNVQGTRNTITACAAACVPYLVYTSTSSVVFDGSKQIEEGDEFYQDYAPLGPYASSKAKAEWMVLEVNGMKHNGIAWQQSHNYQQWCREHQVQGQYLASSSTTTSTTSSSRAPVDDTPAHPAPPQAADTVPAGVVADTRCPADQQTPRTTSSSGGGGGATCAKQPAAGDPPGSRQQAAGPSNSSGPAGRPQPPSSATGSGSGHSSSSGGAPPGAGQGLRGDSPPVKVLRTCALRPSWVWGAGETRSTLQLVEWLQRGQLRLMVGEPSTLVDYTHVDNLVQAQLLAVAAMGPQTDHIASGQAYFITDNEAANPYVFLRPIVEGLGYTLPQMWIDRSTAYLLVRGLELLRRKFKPVFRIPISMPSTQIMEWGKTHYFSVQKAQRQLGYRPVEHDPQEVVEWLEARGYHKRDHQQRQRQQRGSWWYWVLVLLVAAVAVALMQVQ